MVSAALAEPDDRQLVAALRQGDEAAFGRLVDRYHPSLIRIATLFVRDYAIAENPYVLIEHKDVLGLTVQARVNNLLERESVLTRQVFTGPRGSSPLLFSENRRREIGRVVNFVVKGSF